MRKAVLVGLFVLLARGVAAQEAETWQGLPLCLAIRDTRPITLATHAYVIASGIDVGSTLYWVGKGEAREVGFGKAFQDRPIAFAATKLGLTAAVSWSLVRLSKDHPKLAFWTAIGATGFEASVTAWNASKVNR